MPGPPLMTGVEGAVMHTTTVSLTVTAPPPDFSLSVSPSSVTINRGKTATYTVTPTPITWSSRAKVEGSRCEIFKVLSADRSAPLGMT